MINEVLIFCFFNSLYKTNKDSNRNGLNNTNSKLFDNRVIFSLFIKFIMDRGMEDSMFIITVKLIIYKQFILLITLLLITPIKYIIKDKTNKLIKNMISVNTIIINIKIVISILLKDKFCSLSFFCK